MLDGKPIDPETFGERREKKSGLIEVGDGTGYDDDDDDDDPRLSLERAHTLSSEDKRASIPFLAAEGRDPLEDCVTSSL